MLAVVRRCPRPLAFGLCTALLLAGCKTAPEQAARRIEEMKPNALAAASERGQVDLNCGDVKAQLLSHEAGDMTRLQSLQRVVYKVQASGCGRRTTLAVACSYNSVCSAMSEDGMIERE
ncbi:MAG: hypothetical protein KIS79_10955 [Burkholderiales bacterium]|nr:hypothetical protein [Burkholderiales bacterium]